MPVFLILIVLFFAGRFLNFSQTPQLTYVSANSGYNAKWWWSDRYSRETTFNEYIKMIGNAFGYNGPEAKESLQEIKRWFH
ncbi:hypothetical protein SAMN05216192_1133 [Paenibacillus typhae]|uniref:Uncharacterized protein n=1 Tax=Paenibacillus typhae TaxID=1174501 RepID=A0A1G8RNQ5_9BACL|nr:hypothetical protein SAMN05216192_1133 [Paenibacillus typhae]